MWKIRNKEKKLRNNTTIDKIRELGKKARKIATILEEERQKIKAEKDRKEKLKQEQLNREQKKKEKDKQEQELKEKWALYRYITEYIDENNTVWEKERKIREKEQQDWEKKS